MYPPCLVAQLPEAATASDPPVRLTDRASLFLFHIFFLACNSTAESWTQNLLRPRRPWANHYGRRLRAQEMVATAAARRPNRRK
jgi:hypothetical protein